MLNAFDDLKQCLKKDPTCSAEANNCDSAEHCSSYSIAQNCRKEMRLGRDVVVEIGRIILEDNSELAGKDPPMNQTEKDSADTCKYLDCRVFKGLLTDAF